MELIAMNEKLIVIKNKHVILYSESPFEWRNYISELIKSNLKSGSI